MTNLLTYLAVFFVFLGSEAWALGPSFWVTTSTGPPVVTQTIASVSLSNNTINSGMPSGTTVGTLSAIMNPPTPPFSGSFAKSTGTGCTSTGNASFNVTGTTVTTAASLAAADYALCIAAAEVGVPTKLTSFTIHVVAPSNVSLDNTIFTGTKTNTPNNGDTLIANITGCTPSCILGSGGDNPKFKIVAGGGTGPGGWVNSSVGGGRVGPFLMSNGNQGGQANGYDITINGAAFHLGDPPAPSLGTVTALNSGGNVQNALNSVGPGNTVFLNPGTYSGNIDIPSGVRLVSATPQNHLRGQTSRATFNGTIHFAGDGGIVYGLNINGDNHAITFSGSSNAQFINNIVDLGGNNGQWYCSGGDHTLMAWNTWSNASGADNICEDQYIPLETFTRNYTHNCWTDCNGGDFSGSAIVFTYNFWDINVSDGRTLNSAIEDVTHSEEANFWMSSTVIKNNYVLNSEFYAMSLVGCFGVDFGGQDFQYNYIGGGGLVEWNGEGAPNQTCLVHVDNNYFDQVNVPIVQGGGFFGTQGPYGDVAGVSSVRNNREIPNINDWDGWGGARQPTYSTDYIAGSTVSIGAPAPFASGAGP